MTPFAFCIIGGDTRMCWLAQSLAQSGHIVKIYGQEENDFIYDAPVVHCCDMETALDSCHACILGIPCMRDSENISAPFSRQNIPLSRVLSYLSPQQFLFGGVLPPLPASVSAMDYAKDESLLLLNAIPTAEGALQLLMTHTPYVIHGSKIAILGFGRIGQKTAFTLKNMGAIVDVYARKDDSLAKASLYGFNAFPLHSLKDNIFSYHAVINTIPKPIVTRDILQHANKKTMLMELASAPGGFDLPTIKEEHLSYIPANGLPGKVAPQSAAQYIQNTILKRMEEIK